MRRCRRRSSSQVRKGLCVYCTNSGFTFSVWKFAQFPGKVYTGTIVALMQITYEQEAEGMRRPKTQTLRLCNHAQSGASLQIGPQPPSPYIAGNGNSRNFPSNYTPEQYLQTTYEQEAVGMGSPKTQHLRLCNQRTKRCELANWSATTIAV